MQRMMALKPMRYGTRRLQAGDYFEAKPKDARILLAVKRAELAREIGKLDPPPADLVKKVSAPSSDEDIKAVRDEYEAVIGKRPFNGWDIETLKAKIAAHGAS